jgi:nitroreductase
MTFGDAIRARRATKAFASTPIPDATLAEILRLTQVSHCYCC